MMGSCSLFNLQVAKDSLDKLRLSSIGLSQKNQFLPSFNLHAKGYLYYKSLHHLFFVFVLEEISTRNQGFVRR